MENENLQEKLNDLVENTAVDTLGENLAIRYLTSHGYNILEQNYTCEIGEIPIIAKEENGTICFIEVKTSKDNEKGLPPETVVTPKVRSHYENIALHYLAKNKLVDLAQIRFDEIAICVIHRTTRAVLRYHENFLSNSNTSKEVE